MKPFLIIFQIILSLILSALIFLQSQNDTESRSNILSSTPQRRGWEKTLFVITLVLLAIFLLSSIIQTLI